MEEIFSLGGKKRKKRKQVYFAIEKYKIAKTPQTLGEGFL